MKTVIVLHIHAGSVFTFGYGHKHPVTGISLCQHYVKVNLGSSNADRCWILNRFGQNWAFQYCAPPTGEQTAEDCAGVRRYRLIRLPLSEMPPEFDPPHYQIIDGVITFTKVALMD